MDDITAFINGRNKELLEMAEKVSKKLKRVVEEEGLKLSITERWKEGTCTAITSCKYLEERFQECSKKGVALETSVETLGVDVRTRTKQLGAKEKARRTKCEGLSGKIWFFSERLHENWCGKAVEDEFGSCVSVLRASRGQAMRH